MDQLPRQVPNESEDLSALTPNDILLLRRNPYVASEDNRNVGRCQTRREQVNHLAVSETGAVDVDTNVLRIFVG